MVDYECEGRVQLLVILGLRLAALAAAAVALVGVSACGDDRATLTTFAGTWMGHTRGLKITSDGRAKETIYSGCCDLAIRLEFRLSEPRGTASAATAKATVTAVRVVDAHAFTAAHPPPHVGESRLLGLRDGVITEPLTGTNYCSATAKHWVCGA